MSVEKEYLESTVGMKLENQAIIKDFLKMGLKSVQSKNDPKLFDVSIPFFRTDILHQCDLAEDLAIAIGYNNIPFLEPEVICTGEQNKLNAITELMR